MVLFGSCLGFLSNKPAAAAAAAVVTIEPTPMQLKLMKALEKKKEHFARKFEQELSFTRVLLKLGTVKTFMHDVRKVFEDRDTDKSGHIDMSEMSAAMKALNVKLTEDEVKSLFEMADFYEDNQLTLKQFLVVLAMGYVLDAIPDLIEGGADAQADAPARTAGRRRSTFYDKERIVRETLELFTYAYLLFDKECKGVISREQVMFVVAENGQQDTGSMNILSQERWEEMDWDSNGDISFGEFVYAFTKWVDFEGGDEDTEEHKEPKPPADTSRLGGLGRRLSSITAVPAAFADPGRQGGQGRRKSSVTALPPESIELARTGGQGRRRSSVTVAPPPPTGSVDLARQGGQGRRKSFVTAVAAPRRSSVSVKDIGRRLSSVIARGPTEKDVSSRRLTGSYRVVAEGSASPLADQALTAQNTPEGNAGAAPFPSSSGTTDVADKAEQGQKQEQHQEKGKEKGQKQEIGQSAQEQGSIAPAVLADGGADAG